MCVCACTECLTVEFELSVCVFYYRSVCLGRFEIFKKNTVKLRYNVLSRLIKNGFVYGEFCALGMH